MSTHDERDQDLRALLHETADGIVPSGDFEEIKERTMANNSSGRRWLMPAAAAAVIVGLVIGGAWMLTEDDGGTASPPPATQGPNPTPTGDATADGGMQASVPVYWVGDAAQGARLFREFQDQEICPNPGCLLLASARAAVAGQPEDPDYRTAWPAGTTVESATYDGDVLTVDLRGDVHDLPAGTKEADAEMAIQQLIYSAQAGLGEGRVPVQLFLDGSRTDTVLGVPTAEPLAAADDLDVLAPVQISSPADGATTQAGKVEVTGVAAVFEANVLWEVTATGDDAIVKSGHTTAAECCKFAAYEFQVDLGPGTYTIVVHDEDMSGEGRPVNRDTRVIVVE